MGAETMRNVTYLMFLMFLMFLIFFDVVDVSERRSEVEKIRGNFQARFYSSQLTF